MGQILVRKLDDAVLKEIKARAKAKGRSAEAEVRDILTEAVGTVGRKRVPLASLIGVGHPKQTQAEIDAYIRKLRDEWER